MIRRSLAALGILSLSLACGPPPSDSNGETVGAAIATNLVYPEPRGKRSDRFPDIELVTQHGATVRLHELVRDRIVIANFMYTTCTGI